MKALTLHQPGASLVALGVKTIETRSWSTSYRGPLAIHAGLSVERKWCGGGWWLGGGPAAGRRVPRFLWGPIDGTDCDTVDRCRGHAPIDHVRPLPLGAVVASCMLVDVVPMVDDRYARNVLDVGHPGETTMALRIDDVDGVERITDVTGQRPYGDFTPGRYAWLLDDARPTTERCPACQGKGQRIEHVHGHHLWGACITCDGAGHCDPLPAKGRQGLWEWTP